MYIWPYIYIHRHLFVWKDLDIPDLPKAWTKHQLRFAPEPGPLAEIAKMHTIPWSFCRHATDWVPGQKSKLFFVTVCFPFAVLYISVYKLHLEMFTLTIDGVVARHYATVFVENLNRYWAASVLFGNGLQSCCPKDKIQITCMTWASVRRRLRLVDTDPDDWFLMILMANQRCDSLSFLVLFYMLKHFETVRSLSDRSGEDFRDLFVQQLFVGSSACADPTCMLHPSQDHLTARP